MKEINNPQDQQKELIKIKEGMKGFIYFLINYCIIEGIIVKNGLPAVDRTIFKIWKWQVKYIVKALFTMTRIISCKARQMGFSTVCLAYILWTVRFHPNKRVLLLSESKSGAIELLRKIKRMYEGLPDWLKTDEKYLKNNELELGFTNIGSFIIAKASSDSAGSGYTFHIILFDEAAKHEHAESSFTSVLATSEFGQMIVISTPLGSAGKGAWFCDMWHGALKGDINFHAVPIYWWLHPYRVKKEENRKAVIDYVENDIFPTKEQLENFKTEEWYQTNLKNHVAKKKGTKGGRVGFMQEYEMYFSQTGDPVFDEEYCVIKTKTEAPIKNHKYVIGLDPSQGVGGDYAVAQVLDITNPNNIKQVHTLRSNSIAPDLFAIKVIKLSIDYNTAQILMEVKDKASGMMLATFNQKNYNRHLLIDTNNKVGFETNHYNKTDIINELIVALRDDIMKLSDEATVQELKEYVYNTKGGMEGLDHDDTVMSLAIALYAIKLLGRRTVREAKGNM